MCDGGESGDVLAEHTTQRLGLSLTELWELGCDLHDRAVVLTQLRRTPTDAFHGGRIAVFGEGVRDRVDRIGTRSIHGRREAIRQTICSITGEGNQRLRVLRHEANGLLGEVTRCVIGGEPAGIRDGENRCRSTASALRSWPIGRTILGLHQASRLQAEYLPPGPSGGDSEPLGKHGNGRWPLFDQGARDPLCGFTGEFHNPIVAIFPQSANRAPRLDSVRVRGRRRASDHPIRPARCGA